MPFDAFGAPQFGLNDVKVAVWNSTDSYGTAVDIPSVQMLDGSVQMVSAQLEGDDAIQATASRLVGGEVQVRFGSVSIAVLEVIMGSTSTASGVAPNLYDNLKGDGGDVMPYFGICGKVNAEEGSGDMHIFYPKCKITGDFSLLRAEYGQFIIPEVTIQAVDDATYGVYQIIEHETALAVAIPPTNAV